ncbi:hypothetical protein EYZ11_009169 [Aspergillus tanneri]|uniref:Uncharacterized protein n=1 Tax=Aspergillus tanneri TaxID=1220188 RepID=A0A4S3J8S0_9EURO|nr:hypothetical protein EYZ11_009169 [Aspergillus tanneri]
MAFPVTNKWHTQRTSISLRVIATICSLATLIVFGWSQTMFESDMLVVEDLGNAMVSPITGAPYYISDGYSCGVNGRPDCNGKIVANVEHFGTAMACIAL